MTVTIKDVAKLAGVSPTTVSRVLNDSYLVKEDTARQVMDAVQKLNYKPNESARVLRTRNSRLIGFIGSGMENIFLANLLKGIETEALENGYNVLFGDSAGELERELHYLKNMEQKQVEGIIITSANANLQLMNAIRESSVPVVFASANIDEPDIASVGVDNLTAAFEAVNYLLKGGHSRIGIIRGTYADTVSSGERMKGVRLALKNCDLVIKDEMIIEGDFSFQSGYTGAEELLEKDSSLTAIFAFNDEMAIGAMRAVEKMGKCVPDDISILGFDNIELSSYVRPALSTVHQSGHYLGNKSLQLLNRMLNDDDGEKKLFIPHKLIVRKSTRQLH